jgi:hypothetical protein
MLGATPNPPIRYLDLNVSVVISYRYLLGFFLSWALQKRIDQLLHTLVLLLHFFCLTTPSKKCNLMFYFYAQHWTSLTLARTVLSGVRKSFLCTCTVGKVFVSVVALDPSSAIEGLGRGFSNRSRIGSVGLITNGDGSLRPSRAWPLRKILLTN